MSNFRRSALFRSAIVNRLATVAVAILCLAACSDDAASPDAGTPDGGQNQTGNVVFVNPNPTTYTEGATDSFANVSSIVNGTARTTGVPTEAAAVWPEIVTCLREMLAPYDVSVVEEDPGDIDHIEIAVSNVPSDIGLSDGVGGYAQTTCAPLPRGIAFAFAGVFRASVRASCENLGWLLGHTLGLETVYHCPDVNTFLAGCGDKSFTDNDSPCGDFEVRDCNCGGATQNSHQRLLEVYGARP